MAPDPRVRQVGRFEDMHGTTVIVGVDYDAITVSVGLTPATLTRAQAEEFAQLFIAACWEAADHGGRMAAEL